MDSGNGFVHLHTHTMYSLLDSSNKIKNYVARVKELGMTAAAITDHGNMYGVIDFYKACKSADIKPIIGCEVYVAPGSRFEKRSDGSEDRYYHLILLAENNVGYNNLSHIVSKSFIEGFYYKPRVDYDLLREYHEGIIASSACIAGEVAKHIIRGNEDEARAAIYRYIDIFGPNNFFLEVQDHLDDNPDQKRVNLALIRLSKEMGIPLIATNDCHYTLKEDAEAHDILLCMQTQRKVTDADRMRYPGGQYYVKSEEEMRALFPSIPEALENTVKIADRCNVTIEFGHTKLPHFEVPEGYNSWTYLNHLCDEGMKERYPDDDGSIRKQLDYELGVIQKMGYVDYFLIVWDYINYAREHGIIVGPGRGSAAGSLVSYCTHITNIDPVHFGLVFERFLNPERVSMPDIDVDFDDERRGEVIQYVTKKYGADCVTQIITFGTLAARGVIKDVARVFDIPYAEADKIARLIPQAVDMTLAKAMDESPDFKKLYDTDKQAKKLIDFGMKLEGLPRHTSVHAAGVVICAEPAENLIPLSRASDGSVTTAFGMTTVENLGLLKMDFLGLKTLSVIRDATRAANKKRKKQGLDPIDIDKIDYADQKVFSFIGTGNTDGVFQLESAGMQNFMRKLRPTSIEDLTAGISLYRPGPMDFIPKYIEGKMDPVSIKYATPELEPILKNTYGCIVYQEQVMQIVRDLGGYSMGQSDNVRRAMSKKKQDVMDAERQNFVYGNPNSHIAGCLSKGISEEAANNIYDTMIDFAKYAFNKSHAACYAVVSFQTAFLRYYYPEEYMAALLSSVMNQPKKEKKYIRSLREAGMKISHPDINLSEEQFVVDDEDNIRFALTAIKGLGEDAAKGIIREREERGAFASMADFIERCIVRNRIANNKVLENGIKSGAFDTMPGNRKQKLKVYEGEVQQIKKSLKNTADGQVSLFDFAGMGEEKYHEVFPEVDDFEPEVRLNLEKEATGVYLTGHPLKQNWAILRENTDTQIIELTPDDTTILSDKNGKTFKIGGIISDVVRKKTKRGTMMCTFTLEDLTGEIKCFIFDKKFDTVGLKVNEEAKAVVEGKLQVKEGEDPVLFVDDVKLFESLPRVITIAFDTQEECAPLSEADFDIKLLVKDNPGQDRVMLFTKHPKTYRRLSDEDKTNAAVVFPILQEMFGKDRVRLN